MDTPSTVQERLRRVVDATTVPGCSKSLIASTLFAAYAWISRPTWRLIVASYDRDVALRDARRHRELVAGDRWRERWPEVGIPRGPAASTARDLAAEMIRDGATVLWLPTRFERAHAHRWARDPRKEEVYLGDPPLEPPTARVRASRAPMSQDETVPPSAPLPEVTASVSVAGAARPPGRPEAHGVDESDELVAVVDHRPGAERRRVGSSAGGQGAGKGSGVVVSPSEVA